MTTYEDGLLAARFAALAPEPLPGDWDDVLERAGVAPKERRRLERSLAHRGRRRRLLVALAALALVALATTAAWGLVRVFILDKGFVGLPPVGATTSTPESGKLVLSFSGRNTTLGLRMTSVFVYADGRVIWVREGGAPDGANKFTSGFLEQRLTAEGVELLRSEVISSGLFGHDMALITGSKVHLGPSQIELFRGTIQARNRGRLVRVSWMNRAHLRDVLSDFPGTYAGTTATPEQERALERLDPLLADPAASLPASAWEDRTVRAYVPSRYAVCWGHRPELGIGTSGPSIEPSRILPLLPPAVEDLLRHRGFVPQNGNPPKACSAMPTEEARAVAQALDAEGLEKRGGGEGPGSYNEYGLVYRFRAPDQRPGHVYISFGPILPHGEWISIAGG
jgi:hypothetical protein